MHRVPLRAVRFSSLNSLTTFSALRKSNVSLAISPTPPLNVNVPLTLPRHLSSQPKPKDHKMANDRSTHDHDHPSHSHSHSIFGHSHSHDSHSHGAEQLVAAFNSGKRDRGSYITLVGLVANVALSAVKGVAGWYMHSASLLADAGHSLSDLLGDFVTLFCWNFSRKPPSEQYPYGFAKFETIGTTTISILLIGGALGIGAHSYHLLLASLSQSLHMIPPGAIHDLVQNFTNVASSLPTHGHSHSHVETVDVNAAWFAAASVLIKEWLYWVTKKVADEEHSSVLMANAIHHRSDAYSSVVALAAILGTWYFPALPLDPIGGLLVSLVILRQGYGLLKGAWGELTDAGISKHKTESIQQILTPLLKTGINDPSQTLISVKDLRARSTGSVLFIDLTAKVDRNLSVVQTTELEQKIVTTLKEAKKEVTDVRVKFEPDTCN